MVSSNKRLAASAMAQGGQLLFAVRALKKQMARPRALGVAPPIPRAGGSNRACDVTFRTMSSQRGRLKPATSRVLVARV
jgi:hypothetical protein